MEPSLKEKVFAAADALARDGRKVSARAILAETGGSMSNVALYYRQWRELRDQAQAAQFQLSDALQAAIKADIARHVAAARAEFQSALDESADREKELCGFLEAVEQQASELEGELALNKKAFDTLVQKSREQAAVLGEKITALTGRCQALEKEREQLAGSQEALRADLIKAKLEGEIASRDLSEAQGRLQTLLEQVETLRSEKQDATLRAAVHEARCDELAKQLALHTGEKAKPRATRSESP